MRSLRAIAGLPVLLDGKTIGYAADAELDERLSRFAGLYVEMGLLGQRYVEDGQVLQIGERIVQVKSRGVKSHRQTRGLFRRAYFADGRRAGAICGALFDENTREVCALRLTRGIWDDLISGREWIWQYSVNAISGEVLLKPEGGTRHEGRNGQGNADRRDGRCGGDGSGLDDEPSDAAQDGAHGDGFGAESG